MNKPEWDKKSLVSKAAHFTIGNGVYGPFYEFGVFQGQSMAAAYWAFKYAYSCLLSDYGFLIEEWNRKKIEKAWAEMKFIGIDSFSGLPKVEGNDFGGAFGEGNYSCTIENVLEKLKSLNVEIPKIGLIKGWFKDIDLKDKNKASVIHIDCDLYQSAVDALNICTELVQDGTIIIFDDWFQFKGSPRRGEQKAFYEWIEKLAGRFTPVEYFKEDIWRNSFIMSENIEPFAGDDATP